MRRAWIVLPTVFWNLCQSPESVYRECLFKAAGSPQPLEQTARHCSIAAGLRPAESGDTRLEAATKRMDREAEDAERELWDSIAEEQRAEDLAAGLSTEERAERERLRQALRPDRR